MASKHPMVINDLPNELLLRIISYLEGRRSTKSSLASLCLVSQRFRAIAEPSLYASFHDGARKKPQRENKYRSFLYTILTRPDLASRVKHASIGPWNALDGWIKLSTFQATKVPKIFFLNAADKFEISKNSLWREQFNNGVESADLFLLLLSLPRLESLTLRFSDFQEHWIFSMIPQSLKTLKIIFPSNDNFVQTNTDLPFDLPCVESLTAVNISDFGDFEGMFLSTIKHLDFTHACVTPFGFEAFQKILAAPSSLQSFRWSRNPDLRGHISLSQMLQALEPQKSSLQSLYIHMEQNRGFVMRNWDPYKSLRSFEQLHDLFLDLTVFSDIHNHNHTNDQVDANAIIDFLPSSIRFFRMVNESFRTTKALRTLQEVRDTRFPHLERMTFRGGRKIVRLRPTSTLQRTILI